MSMMRQLLMQQNKDYGEPLTDIDGNVILTTLPNDTTLYVKNIINKDTMAISYGNFSVWGGTGTITDGIFYLTPTGTTEVRLQRNRVFTKGDVTCSIESIKVETYPFAYSQNQLSNTNYVKIENDDWNRNVCFGTANGEWYRIVPTIKTAWQIKDICVFDITTMFADCTDKMPSSEAEFNAMFWSDGSNVLGYIPYTEEAVKYIVHGGKLYAS